MPTRILLVALAIASATPARADLRLLDEPLRLREPPADLRPLALVVAQNGSGGDQKKKDGQGTDAAEGKKKSDTPPGMDFDLLGAPEQPPPPSTDVRAMRLRGTMLKTHQAIGLGLVALQLATTTVGQLNYSDKFHGGPNTNRYKTPHAVLAYANLGVFVTNGAIALLAPEPPGTTSSGFDRVTLHKISMFTAAAGMAAQGVLGVYTAHREGFQNQERFATTHLAIGYATLAALLTGVGAMVF